MSEEFRPAPLPRGANAAMRWGILLLALFVPAVPLALMGWVRTPYVTGQSSPLEQPVPFDHRHHVVDDGIDCRYCHDLVERSPVAGVPSADRCMNCHSQVWNESPLLETVRESYYSGRPIAWARVHRLPDFVFFDHSIHVHKGVGCETCHGRVDRMARVYQAAPLTMGWCLSCHRDPERFLRPRDQVTTMGWTADRGSRRSGAELARLYRVKSLTDCTTCHR